MRDGRDFDPADCDLTLFGAWPEGQPPGDDGEADGWPRMASSRRPWRVVLELKSAEAASPVDQLVGLLNELTEEMGEQFRLFRALRGAAEASIRDEVGGEGTDAKAARADAKSATDAMSLIVRTLEKVDGLQRQLARDRAEAEARRAEEDDDDTILERLERIIEARAEERAQTRFRRWKDEDGASAEAGGLRPRAGPGDAPGPGGG